jgi:hypothetical protein
MADHGSFLDLRKQGGLHSITDRALEATRAPSASGERAASMKSSLVSAAIKVPAQRVPQSPDSVDNRKELSGRQPGEGEEKVGPNLSLFVSILFSSF